MRIAFFGGSFDPPHRGHLAIARAARERLRLDRVLLAPVGLQPLKRDILPAGFTDRLAMLRLLMADEPGVEVSAIDAPRDDGLPNYSFDTVTRLREQMGLAAPPDQPPTDQPPPDDAESVNIELFMLLGADSFLTMRQWHRAAELMMLCDWIVAGRPGFALGQAEGALPIGIALMGEAKVHELYTEHTLEDESGRRSQLYLLEDLHEDVSATAIRTALAERGQPADQLLPSAVERYIRDHGLYR